MSSRFSWQADTPSPHDGYDPYGEWSTGHGSAYELSNLEEKEHPQDFTYAVELRSFTGQPDPRPARDALFSFTDDADQCSHLFCLTSTADEDDVPKAARRMKLPAPLRHRSINPKAKKQPKKYRLPDGTNPGQMVVIGCIDDGINIAHDRFRCLNGDGSFSSRVDFAWVQDGTAEHRKRAPAFGREWTRQDIEAAIAESHGDEDALLTSLQLIDFTRPGRSSLGRSLTHGTAVLDLAAGAASQTAAADAINQRIVSVQLPALVTLETSGALLNLFLLAGVQYILRRARLISKRAGGSPLPVILNFSFGVAGGPHDGQHFIERAFEALVAQHRAHKHGGDVHIVIPAGNLFLARGHASVTASSGASPTSINLPWRVQPDDHTSSYLEIWLPSSAGPPDGIEVKVQGPGDATAATVLTPATATRPMVLKDSITGDVIARLTLDKPDTLKRKKKALPGRWRVLLALAATASTDPSLTVAPAGLWHVTLSATIAQGEVIQAWIQRDNAPVGYTSLARQSWFDDAAYERFDQAGDWQSEDNSSPVKRFGSLNGIATGTPFVVIGGYQYRDKRQSLYSAASDGTLMRTPDASAVADTSRQLPGILAAGSRSGSRTALNGTSVAVPQVTRLIAREAARPANRNGFNAAAFVQGEATRHEAALSSEGYQPLPPQRSGAGRLEPDPAIAWGTVRAAAVDP